jgi:hypothetical protein
LFVRGVGFIRRPFSIYRGVDRVPVSDFCANYFDDLWKEIEKWAADELRSVNGQIAYVLRQAVGRRKADRPKDE